MSIASLLAGCFLLYGKSRYFPAHLSRVGEKIKAYPWVSRLGAYALFIISIVLLGLQLGWATGILTFFIGLLFGYCLLLIILPLNHRYIYLLAGLCVMAIIAENIL